MIALALAVMAGYGVFLVYTHVAFGWSGLRPGPYAGPATRSRSRPSREWLAQAGLSDIEAAEFAAAITLVFFVGALFAYALFGGPLAALLTGVFAASLPVAAYRQRRRGRRAKAQEAWPRLIEEIRILTSSVGRSIPQALFEVGLAGPPELRPAFAAAQREWQISIDFDRTLDVLKGRLADPTADATCETLLIAHELGGTDVDRRLASLADDRRQDVQHRKDARAQQAGVRFARRFVLIVPLGMALAGLSVGNGQSAYRTPTGQVAVALALGLVALCWVWAGHLMRLPDEQRVFRPPADTGGRP